MRILNLPLPLALFIALLTALPVQAQDVDGDGYVQVLLPIAISSQLAIPGAHGSVWRQELWVANNSARGFNDLQLGAGCNPEPCRPSILPSGVRQWFSVDNNRIEGGALFTLWPDQAAGIHLSSRLLEISRRAQPNGIDIPLIREDQFLRGPSMYLGIPATENVRSRLRVYDPRHRPGSAVRVEILDGDGRTIGETTLSPGNDPARVTDTRFVKPYPTFDLVSDLATTFPQVRALERYHIRITPLVPGMEYWAFVAVTDVESQHLLLITPQ